MIFILHAHPNPFLLHTENHNPGDMPFSHAFLILEPLLAEICLFPTPAETYSYPGGLLRCS